MLKEIGALALPMIAVIAVAGLASAYPFWDVGDMAQEEKDARVSMLELRQEMLQSEIAYLKEEITQEQHEEDMESMMDEMRTLQEQLMELTDAGDGCACPHGRGMGPGFGPGFGRAMKRGRA